MNIFSLVFFLLGILGAGLFAIGMDPYSCGVPLLLMAVAVAFGAWRRDASVKIGWVTGLIAVTVVYYAVRMFYSPIADFARSDALLLTGVVLAFWWSLSNGVKNSFVVWLGALWVIAIANVAVAMVQAYQDVNFYPIYGERATLDFPSGLYLHYNHFSNFLLGVGMLSFGFGIAGRMKRWTRLACLLMYGICCYGIYLAHSRGAWLGLGCGSALVVVGWLANLWRCKTSWAGVALIVATVLAPMVITGAWHVGSSAVSNRNTGDSGRLEFASIAVDLIQEKPIWGGGSRSYFFDSFEKWNPKELWVGSGDIQYVHNEYLQAAVDYGLVGMVLVLLIFLIVTFRGVVLLTISDAKAESNPGIVLGTMSALFAMGVQAFFSFVYHVLPDVILMGCCVGWLVRQPWALDHKQKAIQAGSRISWRYGAVGVMLAIAAVLVSARDAAGWLALYQRMDFKRASSEERIARYKRAIAVRPDFRVISAMTKVMVQMNHSTDDSLEVKRTRLESAIAWQELSHKRCPNSYLESLNLALMYDAAGRLAESEPLYEKVLKVLGPREMFYGAHYFFARHLAARANVVWRQREPEKALVLFMRAKEEMAKSQSAGYFKQSDPNVKLMIEKSITFLQTANIKPIQEE